MPYPPRTPLHTYAHPTWLSWVYVHADREVELTYQLQMQALEYAPVLVTATELVAELDW